MDLAKIEELIQIVKSAQVSELTLKEDGSSITVKKSSVSPPPQPAHKPAVKKRLAPKPEKQPADAGQAETVEVTAPMVGIFHNAASPVQLGSTVKPGEVIGAIESMKLMNDIIAEAGGVVTEVDVEDGLPVEFGQVLFRLTPGEA
ncbi:MAG: biotin/lipoyl-containing protein [Armatimonadota bacterium]|nr:biotin/lipoyl-containing protein [Armatimonadota bacterium]